MTRRELSKEIGQKLIKEIEVHHKGELDTAELCGECAILVAMNRIIADKITEKVQGLSQSR
jgi:hypothetical protein